MKEIEIIASRKKWICTKDDIIESNGKINWLESKRYFKNAIYTNVPPIVSKTELNRLKKLGVLAETERNGLIVYNFCLE